MRKMTHACCCLCLLLACSLLLPQQLFVQPASPVISGRVLDANGQPVAHATVQWKNGGHATSSNEQGLFTIKKEPSRQLLLISCMGFETVTIDFGKDPNLLQQPSIEIKLPFAAKELEEVQVSTGYELLPRERATGSFEKLSQARLNLQNDPNILKRLNGISTGILFDAQATRPPLTLRGISSINGPTAPLIVVDNFPYEGDISNINPNDVESITLLKDAAAASIWGARAGNGVIVISTKKGQLQQPLQVNFNMNISTREKPDGFYSPQFIAAADYIEVEQFLFGKGFYTSQENSNQKPALSPVLDVLIARRDGRITQAEADQKLALLRNTDRRQQADDYLYSRPVTQQYALQLSGGGQRTASLFSIGYDRDRSALRETGDRLTLRTDNRYQLTSKLELRIGGQYTQKNNRSGLPEPASILVGTKLLPYTRLADDAGNPLPVARQYRSSYTDTAGAGYLLSWQYLPLEDWKHQQTSTKLTDILINGAVNYQLLKHLQLSVQYQYEQQTSLQELLQDQDSYEARIMVNRFSQIDRAAGTVKYLVPKGGMLSNTMDQLLVHNGRLQARYNREWKAHQLSWLGGFELREAQRGSSRSLVYGYDGDVLTIGKVDYVNSYPDFVTGSKVFIRDGTGFSKANNRYTSWYSNLAYTLRQRYTVSASVRKDASNVFGVAANERGVPLWSAGLAWQIGKERFWRQHWLPYLRLRISTGFSGNLDPSRSAYTTLQMISGASGTNLPYANVNQFANPALRWEKVQTSNMGLDFAGRGNRLSGSLEAYIKKGTDLFGAMQLDQTTGLLRESLIMNAAAMRGTGFDLQLNSVNTKGVFSWTSSLLFSYNKSIVTRYYNPEFTTGRSLIKNGKTITPIEGQRLYQVASYRWAGLDPLTGDPRGWLGDSISKNYSLLTGAGTRAGDIVYSGSAIPEYFGSLLNTCSWKGLSLTVCISGKFGYYLRRSSIYYNSLFNGGAGHMDYYARWQKPGDEEVTNIPSMVYPNTTARDDFYTNSEVTVSRGDHLRLQYLQLGYSPAWIKKIQPGQLQFYLNAANLAVLWRADSQLKDPDYPDERPARSIALGLRWQVK